MAPSKLVIFPDGTVASLPVLQCLWDIEARGGIFVLLKDGKVRVEPPDRMTPSEQAFLRAHLEETRRLVRYQAEDSHLTDAAGSATPTFTTA